jgi:hypothetical protein
MTQAMLYISLFKATKEMGYYSSQGKEIFPFSTASRLALRPTQPLMKWRLAEVVGV